MRSDDEIFVNRCLEGDQPAFAFLVDKYKEVVHAYAYRKVGDYQEAEDITQEVFIKAYRKLAQLKWPHRFRSWLYTIVSNECKMWLRKRPNGGEQEVSWEDVPAVELNELAMRSHGDEDIELTVKSAIEALPDDRQLAVSLYYMSNLSVREIASFMGVSPNSVRIKLHRARKQLGERLEKMIGKHLSKEKLKAGFVFKVVDAIRDMPIPSLPKPRPIRWAPIPISIGLALLIGIIGYGVSSGKDVPLDVPILKPATFEVSLLPDPDGETISDTESENISELVLADAETTAQTQPAAGAKSSGMVVRRVWETGRDIYTVSPDGRYASYINWDKGNVAIHDFETGEDRDITDEGGQDKDSQFADLGCMYTWSPNSKQIAYVWYKGEGASIRVVGIDGSKPRVLLSKPSSSELPWPWSWSSDGKYILMSGEAKTGETRSPALLSVADGSIRVLESLSPSSVHRMSLSPDGRYVVSDSAHVDSSARKSDILLSAVDGGQEVKLVEHPANDFIPFWTPDGNRIVFGSDRSGTRGLWILDVVDGKPKGSPRLIRDNLNGMFPLGLTQDGSYYYKLPGREDDVYFADLDPETGKVVKPPTKAVKVFEGLNYRPDFSPDGKHLAYLSPRGPGRWRRSSSFVIRSLETGEEREIQPDLPLELLNYSAIRWFPDGRSILVAAMSFDSAKERRKGFHRIHVETGTVTTVVWSDKGADITRVRPVFSPDGGKMFFMRQQDGGTSIGIYNLEAEQESNLDLHSEPEKNYRKHNLAISPDGQHLAFVKCSNGHSIQIAPATGGEIQELLPKTGFNDRTGLVWTPDGRYLLFGKWNGEDKKMELWRISVEGGEPENLGLAMRKIEHLSIHPDGRRIAFTGPGLGRGPEVWVMEDILSESTASR